MKRHFGGQIFLWILLAMPLAASASTVLIYVSNEDGSSIDVIDTASNKVVQRIGGIGVPDGVISSPDGRRAYVPDQSELTLDVVDTETGKIIKKVPLSGLPNLPAVTNDGRQVLVAIWSLKSEATVHGAVDIVDTTSLERIKTIPLGGPTHDIFMTPDSKYAIAGSSADKLMIVIDLQTDQPVWSLKFDQHGLRPFKTAGSVLTYAIEKGPDGSTSRVFVNMGGLNGFAVVDFAKRKEVARIEFPDPAFGYLNQPAHGIGISPDGKTLVASSRGTNHVYFYSLPDIKLLGAVTTPEVEVVGPLGRGSDPHWVAFTPDSKTVYLPLSALKSVIAIDVKSMKEVARIPVGDRPRHVATVVQPGSLHLTASAGPATAPLSATWIAQMPDGKAKGTIVAQCQWCHSLQRIVISHRTEDEWSSLVDTMVKLGSAATQTPLIPPDEVPVVVHYLAENFGPKGSK